MIYHMNEIKAEEAKAILAGLIAIRKDADEYDWEAARQDPAGRYVFNSAAEKFGYDTWKFLIKQGVVSETKQEILPIK